MQFNRQIIESSLPRVNGGQVAHYTRIGSLCYFLKRDRNWCSAWATPVQFLNDRTELALGLDILEDAAKAIGKLRQPAMASLRDLQTTNGTPETDAYRMSFSGN